MFCYIVCFVLVAIIILHASLELHYFLRAMVAVLLARFCKKRVHIMQETYVHGLCITTDIDTLLYHMNNARFIRELDFARIDFYERTGLYRCIRNKGGTIAMGAITIRYRRFVRLFNRYIISSKIVYWDEQSVFMEHRFISPGDRFINAIVLTRTRLINCSAEDVMNELLAQPSDVERDTKLKPEMPSEIQKWEESNNISSNILNPGC